MIIGQRFKPTFSIALIYLVIVFILFSVLFPTRMLNICSWKNRRNYANRAELVKFLHNYTTNKNAFANFLHNQSGQAGQYLFYVDLHSQLINCQCGISAKFGQETGQKGILCCPLKVTTFLFNSFWLRGCKNCVDVKRKGGVGHKRRGGNWVWGAD